MVQVFHDRLGPGMHVQLVIDFPHMRSDGVHGDMHPVGNFFIGVTLRELAKKLLFGGR